MYIFVYYIINSAGQTKMNVQQNINKIRQALSGKYSDRETDAFIRIIYENLLRYSPVDIIMHKDTVLSDFISAKIDRVIEELLNNKPIQYIFGYTYFHGHKFIVTPDTLIPRPETEELVDLIITENKGYDIPVLDIGTGSGCIAISLAIDMKFPVVTATDISPAAIEIAEQNAGNLKTKVKFIVADILKTNIPAKEEYSIIVSNPPYICKREKSSMEPNVLDYEPHSALFVPDDNPLLFYRAIAQYSIGALTKPGKLYFEINNIYAVKICTMLEEYGFTEISVHKDVHNEPRFISAVK